MTHVRRLRDLLPSGSRGSCERIERSARPASSDRCCGSSRRASDGTTGGSRTRLHLPRGRHAFELRDPSWFSEDVYAILVRTAPRSSSPIGPRSGTRPGATRRTGRISASTTERARDGNYGPRALRAGPIGSPRAAATSTHTSTTTGTARLSRTPARRVGSSTTAASLRCERHGQPASSERSVGLSAPRAPTTSPRARSSSTVTASRLSAAERRTTGSLGRSGLGGRDRRRCPATRGERVAMEAAVLAVAAGACSPRSTSSTSLDAESTLSISPTQQSTARSAPWPSRTGGGRPPRDGGRDARARARCGSPGRRGLHAVRPLPQRHADGFR